MQTIKKEIQSQINLMLGQTELPNNSGFKESWFSKLMRKVGWKKYHPWCAYAAEAVWVTAYENIGAYDVAKKMSKIFSPLAVQTFKNFVKAGYPHGKVPKKGSLVVWQTVKNGKYKQTGHIGVATKGGLNFISAEGNTSVNGSREGTTFAENKHNINKESKVQNGLRYVGCIYPVEYVLKDGLKKTKAYEY